MRRRRPPGRTASQESRFPKYSIAVVSDLSGVPQQQLRRMEESGLVHPNRTRGNTRRYSDVDLEQIASVADLSEAGINAAGIRHILALQAELATFAAENARLRAENAALHEAAGALPGRPEVVAQSGSSEASDPPQGRAGKQGRHGRRSPSA